MSEARQINDSRVARLNSDGSITREDPTDAGAGSGGVSVEVPPAAPVAVSNIIAHGASIAGDEATLTGLALLVIATANGLQQIPGTDVFTSIVLTNTYDPSGYANPNLPNGGVPGWLVPVGFAGIHRVRLFVNCLVGNPGRLLVGIANGVTSDPESDVAFYPSDQGSKRTTVVESVIQLPDAGEVYVYAQSDSSDITILDASYLTIERLTS